jgi:hypothetical protein
MLSLDGKEIIPFSPFEYQFECISNIIKYMSTIQIIYTIIQNHLTNTQIFCNNFNYSQNKNDNGLIMFLNILTT